MKEKNIVVLDLETAKSADDCKHCGATARQHTLTTEYHCETFEEIGWDNKAALGLSIGCYFDYRDSHIHWFDIHALEETMQKFVETQPLLVSFNGKSFDFPLMQACLTQIPNYPNWVVDRGILEQNWQDLCAASYDILAEIWKVDPRSKFTRGLNSLNAISRANGLGDKLSHGAEAPRRWARGEYAHVLNYCQDDVLKTKALFEQIVTIEKILRGDHKPIILRSPFL